MRSFLALIMLFGSGCMTTSMADKSDSLETLHGIVLMAGQIEVKVTSRGCTDKRHFNVLLKGQQLMVIRKTPDRCKRAPFVKILLLAAPGLGRDAVVVANPFSVSISKELGKRPPS